MNRNNNTNNRIGGPNLPGNENGLSDTVLMGILGGLAGILTGDSNSSSIDNYINKISGTSKENNIFGKVSNIEEYIKDAYDKTKRDALNLEIKNISSDLKILRSFITSPASNNLTAINIAFSGVKDITGLIKALEELSKMNLGAKNDRALSWILNILNTDNGALYKIIESINNINGKINDVRSTALKNIGEFIKLIINITNIPLKARFTAKSNLHFMKTLVNNDFIELADDLLKFNKDLDNKDKKNAIINIGAFFSLVNNAAHINIKHKLRAKSDILYLKNFIAHDIVDICNELSNVSDKTKNVLKDVEYINKFFKLIIDLDNIKSFSKSQYMLKSFIDFFNNEFYDDVDTFISKYNNIDVRYGMDNIQSIFMSLTDIIYDLPKKSEMISGLGKVLIFNELIKKLNLLNDYINLANNININNLYSHAVTLSYFDTNGSVGSILYNLPLKDILKSTKSVKAIIKTINILNNLAQEISKINIDKKNVDTLKNLTDILSGSEILGKTVIATSKSLMALAIISKFEKPIDAGLFVFDKSINKLLYIIGNFKSISPKNVENINETLKMFTKFIAVTGGILVGGAALAAMINLPALTVFSVALTGFVYTLGFVLNQMSKIFNKNSVAYMTEFRNLVITAASTLLIGSIMFDMIPLKSVLGFSAMLAGFITGTSLLLNNVSPMIEPAEKTLKNFTLLVTASGAILLGAAAISKLIDYKNLFVFSGALLGFITGITTVYKYNQSRLASILSVSASFIKVVGLSGAILLGAAAISKLVDIPGLITFGAVLGGFIWGVVNIYKTSLKKIRKAFDISKNFSLLVVASGGIMLAGSILMKAINVKDLVIFTGTLYGFILGISLAFTSTQKRVRSAMIANKDFALLIVASGGILLAGGLMMKLINPADLVLFAGVLGTFIGGITFIYNKTGKYIYKSIKSASALAVLTGISAAALLIGGYLFSNDPNMAVSTITFASTLVTFIGIMGTGALLLGKFAKHIALGGAVMGGLMLISLLGNHVMASIGETSQKYSFEDIIAGAGKMSTVIGIVTAMVAGLGLAATTGVGAVVILAGAGLLTTIVGVTSLAAMAMKSIAGAINDMNNIKNFKTEPIKDNIIKFMDLIKTITEYDVDVTKVMKVSVAMQSASLMCSSVGNVIKDYASLKIPVYTGTKITGYRQLEYSDFKSASENIGLIITTLGNAVITTYDMKPEMFETNFFGNSKFAKVTKSLSKLGPMISEIARGVKNYATLAIPEYNGKDIISYRHLTDTDFINAGKNINRIITTLGASIIYTYNNDKMHMFDTSFWGNSPFGKVTRAMGSLGTMISNIAKGVKDYASLTIPVYSGKDITSYRKLDDPDFINAAKNINRIITIVGNAIIQTYKGNADMFNSPFIGTSPMNKVITAGNRMSFMISRISQGIKDYAELKIAEYDDTGKLTGYRNLTDNDFIQAGNRINTVLTTLGNALINTYHENPDLFNVKPGDLTSPINRVISASTRMSAMISKVAESVKDFAEMRVQIIGQNGQKTGKLRQFTEDDFIRAGRYVTLTVTTIGEGLIKAYEKHPDWFDTPVNRSFALFDFSKNKQTPKSKFEKIIYTSSMLGMIIANVAKGVSVFANASVPVYNSSGKLIGYKNIGPGEINKARINIVNILKSLPEALMHAYDTNSPIFKEKKISRIQNTYNKIIDIIARVAKYTDFYGEGKIPHIVNGKLETVQAPNISKVSENISKIFKAAPLALKDIDREFPEIFKNDNIINRQAKLFDMLNTQGERFVTLLNKSNDLKNIDLQVLPNALRSVNNEISKFSSSSNFDNHVASVEKYVHTLNSVDVHKIDKMTELSQTMYMLTKSIGGLDKFTQKLSNEISSVLQRLADEMAKSAHTIENADRLQDKRKKLIDESIKDIKELMDKSLSVEVYSMQTTNDGTFNMSGTTGGTSQSSGNVTYSSGGNTTTYDTANTVSTSSEQQSVPEKHMNPVTAGNKQSSSEIKRTIAQTISNEIKQIFKGKGKTYTVKTV